MTTAVVVGSGPNGLAAAICLAEAGVQVQVLEAASTYGGGMRSHSSLIEGVIHDTCSAVHPMAIASPFFRERNFTRFGLEFAYPEADLAHPLPDGSAGVLWRDIDRTADGLGADGPIWKASFQPLAQRFDRLLEDVFQPPLHFPRHPWLFGAFGVQAALPAQLSWQRFRSPTAQALFAGVAAHVFTRLDTPMSASVGQLLTTSAHAYGWPVARGGSQSIADAMVAYLLELGGTVRCGTPVTSLHEYPADLYFLDTSPRAAAQILARGRPSSRTGMRLQAGGEAADRVGAGSARQPRRFRRAYQKFAHGPAAAKVDYVIAGNIPWNNPESRRAGTVHLGGTAKQVALAEKGCAKGKLPEHPFILVGQQYLADQTRSKSADTCGESLNPVWAYAHVPHGWDGDPAELITREIERYAPGFRDTIIAQDSLRPADLQGYNANYVGGDILGGYNGFTQLIARPLALGSPYRTGVAGVYLCSASTPPGAGVHGMSGANAAALALRGLT